MNRIQSKPSVATTTVYKKYALPDKAVLKRYRQWNANMEIYATDSIVDNDYKVDKYGVVTTTFDVIEKREYNIETELYGNAVMVSNSL
jgi:hypothetical protein